MKKLTFLLFGAFFLVYDAVAGMDDYEDRWWVQACVEAGHEYEICNAADDPVPDDFLEWFNSEWILIDSFDPDDVILPNGLTIRQFDELHPELKAETEARKRELEMETIERNERSERLFREREEAIKRSESNKIED